jgi:hypothetical protein
VTVEVETSNGLANGTGGILRSRHGGGW